MVGRSMDGGRATADDFLRSARALIQDGGGCESLYDSARAATNFLLRSGAKVPELSQWREALSRIAALASGSGGEDRDSPQCLLSTRLRVLNDLIADANQFVDHYAADRLRDQPHFKNVLRLLYEAEERRLQRQRLLNDLPLTDTNLTRVLKVLEAARLILRHKLQNTVLIELTGEGKATYEKWSLPKRNAREPKQTAELELAHGLHGMKRDKYPATAGDLFQEAD